MASNPNVPLTTPERVPVDTGNLSGGETNNGVVPASQPGSMTRTYPNGGKE
jgi:hypothetical protein